MKLRYNKKAVDVGDVVSYVIMFLIIAFVISYLFISQANVSSKFETAAPELVYNYPSVFVHTFLNQELTEEEKEELNLNLDNKVLLRDLYIDSQNNYNDFLEKKREEYITFNSENGLLDSYLAFSEQRASQFYLLPESIAVDNLDNLPNLDEIIQRGNYYVVIIRDNFRSYHVIWFKYSDHNVLEGPGGYAR